MRKKLTRSPPFSRTFTKALLLHMASAEAGTNYQRSFLMTQHEYWHDLAAILILAVFWGSVIWIIAEIAIWLLG